MVDCIEESQTQHYKANWYGFGPVRDCERVLFAVFEKTKRDGHRLIENSFDTTSLARHEQSVGRASYLTRGQFDRHVIGGATSRKGAFVGIACADVSTLRALRFRIETPVIHGRSLCVIDRVVAGDYDAHATIGYSKTSTPEGISQARLGRLRSRIRMDLADAFSEIIEPNGHQWPSRWQVFVRRLTYLIRVLKATIRARGTSTGTKPDDG
jgi:hypothetical protein